MAEKIEFDASGFSSLKAQIREANIAYQALLANVGATPQAIQAAAAKVADLKDQFNDANDSVNALTQQGKFQALTKGLAAVSGGFTAVQGAISLVSDDTKAFEATFKKLQAAMALTQGLTALADFADAFKGIKTAAIGAFNGIKLAIGSSGIGLLLLGLSAAVAAVVLNFDKLIPKTKTLAEELNVTEEELKSISEATAKQTTNVNQLVNAVTDQNRSEKERRESLKKLKEEYPNYFNNLTNDINDTKTLTSQKDKLIETLIREARVRASQDQIEKIAAKNIGQRMKLNEALIKAEKDQAAAIKEADGIRFKANKNLRDGYLPTEEEWNATIEAQPEVLEKANKAFARKLQAQNKLAQIQSQINALNQQELKDAGVFQQIIGDETEAIQKNGGASQVKTDNTVKNTKKEINAVKEKNEALRKLDEERATDEQDKVTTIYANNLARLKESEVEELAQKNLTDQQKLDIESKYSTLRILNEQQRINAVAKLNKDAAEKLAKEEEERRKKEEEDAKKFAAFMESSAKEEYNDRKREIDKIYGERKLAIDKEEISEKKKLKKLNDLEIERLNSQKLNAQDYIGSVKEAAADEVDIALKTADKIKAIDEDTTKTKIENLQKQVQGTLDAANEVFNAQQAFNDRDQNREMEALKAKGLTEEQAAKETDEINRKYFEKNKEVQVGQAIINTLQSSISAFASLASIPVVGPVLGAIAAAAALAAGYATVQKIQETSYTSSLTASPQGSMYAEGGLLTGRSHNMGGIRTSMGELEGGEFVMNRRATANFLPLLESINSIGNTRGPEVAEAQQPIFKTYVVATEMTSQQEANAKLSALARM